MRKFRMLLTAVLLVTLLLAQSTTALALAKDPAHYSVHLNNATVPWLFPLDSTCPAIPAGVTINPDDRGSDREKRAIVLNLPNGAETIQITDLITGTASSSSDVEYEFVYLNTVTYDFDGSTVTVNMLDSFTLTGEDVNLTTGFNWSWAYPASSFGIVKQNEDGRMVNLGVDPEFFPTHDGVTEDPNIIPGSWKQYSTVENPIFCDPL